MSDGIKRMNYYNGLFLKEDDFDLEQDYHIRKDRIHNYYLHQVWGIADGLNVQPISGTKKFKVTKGVAITQITSASGEKHAVEVVLAANDTESLDLTGMTAGTVYITISYNEVEGDIDTDKGDKAIHIIEKPKIEAKKSKPSDDKEKIILAMLTIPAAAGWKSQQIPIDKTLRNDIKIISPDHNHNGVNSDKIPAINSTHFTNLSGANLTGLNPNNINGKVPQTKIDNAIARDSEVTARINSHKHNGVDGKKIAAISSTYFSNLSGAKLTGLNPNSISGTIPESRIDPNISRDSEVISLLPIIRNQVKLGSQASTAFKTWKNIANMSLTFTLNRNAMLLCIFNASPAGNSHASSRTYWRMLLGSAGIGYAMKHSSSTWELDSVVMVGVSYAAKGKHTVKVQWKVSTGKGYCPHINSGHKDVGMRGLTIVEFPTVFSLATFNTFNTLISGVNLSGLTLHP